MCTKKTARNLQHCKLRADSVIPAGFEPTTHSLEGCCSIQLSYGTITCGMSSAKAVAKINLLFLFSKTNCTLASARTSAHPAPTIFRPPRTTANMNTVAPTHSAFFNLIHNSFNIKLNCFFYISKQPDKKIKQPEFFIKRHKYSQTAQKQNPKIGRLNQNRYIE